MSHVETIKIFSRIRPTFRKSLASGSARNGFLLDQPEPGFEDSPQLHFYLPRDDSQGLINNTRENYDFKFDRVFDADTKQQEVFDVVAKDVIDSVMDGFNGTVFAYGQTGSGKTFTITGGAQRYVDRGLIPRSIQYLFDCMAKDKERQYQMSISYMEIYNEVGYDLLYSTRDNLRLEDLPRIQLMEDDDQVVVRNLSEHPASTDEEALNLLFFGDTNKMIAETPSNPASSRSHCIFTINIVSREPGTAKVRRSKLNLVDLAGSERVSRTKIDGSILKEAKYINLSLHYLEQVIIALHERALGVRSHVPYRNSMMTSILRDSLGGNCKTTMIATVAVEPELINESISTCRFAQRVALIKNDTFINEELDLNIVVENLKREVEFLKAELAIAKGGSYCNEPLEDYEKDRIKTAVEEFINGQRSDLVFGDMRKITEAYGVMKEMISVKPYPPAPPEESPDISALRAQISQRDAEIGVLISMLKDKNFHNMDNLKISGLQRDYMTTLESFEQPEKVKHELFEQIPLPPPLALNKEPAPIILPTKDTPLKLTKEDQVEAWNEFQSTYRQFSEIQERKRTFTAKKEEAKSRAASLKELKSTLTALKGSLEKLQLQKIVKMTDTSTAQLSKNTDLAILDLAISEKKEDLVVQKVAYSKEVASLKELSKECAHLQHCITTDKNRMVQDFEKWMVEVKYEGYQLQFNRETSAPAIIEHLPAIHAIDALQRTSRSSSRASTTKSSSKAAKQVVDSASKLLSISQDISDRQVQNDIAEFMKAIRK